MAAKICNIELGDRIIKVCISEQKGKRYQISSSFLMATPEGTVQDGQITEIVALSKEIRRNLSLHQAVGIKNVNFTLTSSRVVSREVTLPPLKENRIKAAIVANAADYFPVDISSYSVAHCVLEQLAEGAGGWRVQVVAAPKALLESYNALAEALGMKLGQVDYCGNSQYQVLRSIPSEDVVLYVDVNDNNTFVSFISKGVLLLQRNIAAGGGELIAELKEASRSQDYLETLKKASDPAFVTSTLTKEDRRACLNRVIGGIARSEDYFVSGHSQMRVSKVVLMGVCSGIAGLKEDISAAMGGIETVLLQEVDGIRFMANSADGISAYINCIGVLVAPMELYTDAMRGVKTKGAKVKEKKSSSDSMFTSVLLFLICVAVGGAMAGMSLMEYNKALTEETRLKNRKEELAYVEQVYNTYVGYENTKANLDAIAACSETPTAELRAFMEELEKKMPVGMLLLSASANNSGITLNITCPGMEEADVILSQLRGFDTINQIKCSTITETQDQTGFTVASFSVSCGFTPMAERAANAQN